MNETETGTKINYGTYITGEKENRTSKKNVDGRGTSSPDTKKFRTRSVEKQRRMVFGFRKRAAAVIKPDGRADRQTHRQTDRWMDGWMDGWMD